MKPSKVSIQTTDWKEIGHASSITSERMFSGEPPQIFLTIRRAVFSCNFLMSNEFNILVDDVTCFRHARAKALSHNRTGWVLEMVAAREERFVSLPVNALDVTITATPISMKELVDEKLKRMENDCASSAFMREMVYGLK